MNRKMEAEKLEAQARINEMYARRAEETFARSGRESALNSAETHRMCAAEKRARAAKLREDVGGYGR